jgi:hypothetical protein
MNDSHNAHEVRIHIDREPYRSPTPTTGKALYELAKIGEHRELFREVHRDHEDAVVPRDSTEIHLKEDEHFYSEKTVTIIVEGKPHQWPVGDISYVQVVTLEVPDYAKHPEITYSVKYKNGPAHHPEGTLSLGGKVKVKEGMIFSVSESGQS